MRTPLAVALLLLGAAARAAHFVPPAAPAAEAPPSSADASCGEGVVRPDVVKELAAAVEDAERALLKAGARGRAADLVCRHLGGAGAAPAVRAAGGSAGAAGGCPKVWVDGKGIGTGTGGAGLIPRRALEGRSFSLRGSGGRFELRPAEGQAVSSAEVHAAFKAVADKHQPGRAAGREEDVEPVGGTCVTCAPQRHDDDRDREAVEPVGGTAVTPRP